MKFHEEIEYLLYSINSSSDEHAKSHYYQKLEAVLENYMKSRSKAVKRAGGDLRVLSMSNK